MNTHLCPYCGTRVDNAATHCPNCGGTQTVPPTVRMSLPVVDTVAGPRKLLDPWMVTHPDAKRRFEGDATAVKALVETWRLNPDMASTVETQTDIAEAVNRGDLTYAESYYYCCPWSPVYTVEARSIRVGDRRLTRGEQFTFDISAEEVPEGGDFKSEILVADFSPTDKIDYCLPGQGGHDD